MRASWPPLGRVILRIVSHFPWTVCHLARVSVGDCLPPRLHTHLHTACPRLTPHRTCALRFHPSSRCMHVGFVSCHSCTRLVWVHLSGVVPFRKGIRIGFDWTWVSVSNPKRSLFVDGFDLGFRRRPFRSRHVARAPLVRHPRALRRLSRPSCDGRRRGEEGRTSKVHPSEACEASMDPRLTHACGWKRAAADLRKCHGVRRRERIRRVRSGSCTSRT